MAPSPLALYWHEPRRRRTYHTGGGETGSPRIHSQAHTVLNGMVTASKEGVSGGRAWSGQVGGSGVYA